MLKKAAYQFWKVGLNIVPLKITKKGNEWDKKPLVKWHRWTKRKQTEEEFNGLPWKKCNGFAIVLGRLSNGLFFCCIDYDVKHTESQEVRELGRKIMEQLPKTRWESTVNGGIHAFYISREDPKTESKYHSISGVELLGTKKLCVMWPSSGYEVLRDSEAVQIDNANKLLEETLAKYKKGENWFGRSEDSKGKLYRGSHPPCIKALLDGVPEGERNEIAIRLASYLLNFRQLKRKTTVKRLREWNEKNKPPLPEKELLSIVSSAEKHHYIYGCNDAVLKMYCNENLCPLFSKRRDLTSLQLIERELATVKIPRLHPLIDFHPELGYTLGLVLDQDTGLIIINKEAKTFDIEAATLELESSTPILVERPKFAQISARWKEGILQLAKALIKGEHIEETPKESLFNAILKKVRYYWFHSDERWIIFAACFVIATYYHRMFLVFGHWVLQGIRESGKTTMGMILQALAWNPTEPQSGLRSAPLFRGIEDSRPTFIIDVTRFNPKDMDLNDMLEVIEPHGVVSRCVGEQKDSIRRFHVFCPKVMMVRQTVRFSDKSIECVTESAPTGTEYSKRRTGISSDSEMKEIVHELLMSVISNWRSVCETYKALEQDNRLFGRRFDLWRPFLAVCKVYSEENYEKLLSLAYEDAEQSEKGDATSDVEDTLIGGFIEEEEKKQSVVISLKDLTEETQGTLGESVVRSYHIVQSALKNLKVVRRKINTSSGVKYQIDLKRAREIAKERGIITGIPVCSVCGACIVKGQEVSTDAMGNLIHKSCVSGLRPSEVYLKKKAKK